MDIAKKWESTKLLNVFQENLKENAARCLEAQINFNKIDEKIEPNGFDRVSVPLLVRMFSNSKAFSKNNFDFAEEVDVEGASTHMFSTEYKPQNANNLKEESAYVAELSKQLLREFDELFGDQTNRYIEFHGIQCTNRGNLVLRYKLS